MPAYNVEEYVDKAIKSVLCQTYPYFELIIIDDGSTDNSFQICKIYKESDDRIILVHQENHGLSSARNLGLKIASGEYILFIDSDDLWFDQNVLDNIDKNILENRSELVVFSFAKAYLDKKLIYCNVSDWDCQLNRDPDSLIEFMIRVNIYKACAWNKCIKKEIVDTYRMMFPEGYVNEDIVWCGDLLRYCQKISYINDICYVYRQGRKGSITSSKNEKNISDRVKLICKGVEKIPEEEKRRDAVLSYYAYEYCVSLGLMYFIKNRKTKKQIQTLKKLLANNMNKKVRIVHDISNILGFNMVRLLLCIFVKVKR